MYYICKTIPLQMDSYIQIRCDSTFKTDIEKHANQMGFGSVSDYIRFTLKSDIKKNGIPKKSK